MIIVRTGVNAVMPIKKRLYCRMLCAVFALLMTVSCLSCGDNKSNDTTMTESLIASYMNAFRDYNISGMNKCCMVNLDPYDDSDAEVKACRAIAERVDWESLPISIDGNSAIAQLKLTVPADVETVCGAALNDTVKALDGGSDDNYADLLIAAIKKRAGNAKTVTLSVEIHMTKVDNKWYIVKSLGVNRFLSEIRTSVTAAFSLIEG